MGFRYGKYRNTQLFVCASKFQMSLSEEQLINLCRTHQLGVEDWTTMRFICGKCSTGNPGPHVCDAKPLEDGSRRFGFGAKKDEDLSNVLRE